VWIDCLLLQWATDWLCGAECFLRRWRFFSSSRNSPHFANQTVHYCAHNSPSVEHSARSILSISLLRSVSQKSVLIINSIYAQIFQMPSSTPVSPNNPLPPLFSCTFQMPPHISFNHPVTFSQQHWPWSSPLCTLLHSTFSQFLSPTNISLSTIFSDTPSFCLPQYRATHYTPIY